MQSESGQVDAKAALVELLLRWMARNGERELPAPCPYQPDECAEWWLGKMQEPAKPSEKPVHYMVRVRSALFNLLALTDAERKTVCALVIKDHIRWRGEPIEQYIKIAEETERCREIGIDAYRTEALAKMRSFCGSFSNQNIGGQKVA